MWRMSMSRLQSLSTTWRQRHPEQPLGIPGHKSPSLPQHCRWNWISGQCLSRKCSSSKLQLVPGRRESDIGSRSRLTSVRPHEIQRRHNSQFPTPSFQTTIPTGFKANVLWHRGALPAQPISCQYPSRKHTRHTTSDHTECVQVKNQFIHFTDSQQKLETGNAKDEHEQTTKPSKKLATKTPLAATWNPGTQQACAPSSPMELPYKSMLVTEVFFFKASASA